MGLIFFSLFFLLVFNSHHVSLKPSVPSPARASQGSNFTYFQTSLDTEDKVHLFWSVDYQAETVTMEVRAFMNRRDDWIGIGFSNYGDIREADLCLLWFDTKSKAHFQDVWTDQEGYVKSEKSNDCYLLNVRRKGTTVRIVFQRKFDTCDPNDYKIEEGTTHVLWVTGKGHLKRATGLRLTDFRHGFQRMQMLKNTSPTPALPEKSRAVEVVNNAVHIPSEETTYWCSLHKLPEELKRKHHIVQYEAVIQPGNEPLVHHMELFHCEVPQELQLPSWESFCHKDIPPLLEPCKRVLSAWAMGAGPLVYPEEAGLPIGGTNFSLYVMLEVHYNNPEGRSDWVDSSGIRLYYTEDLRKYDVGVIETGLEYTDKNSIPPEEASFALSGYCVSECTRAGLPSEGITIFASQLHTHLTGAKVWIKHTRGGQELPEVNRDDHYSPHFQEIRLLKRKVHLLPGDALVTTCSYDTRSRTNMTLGGFAISDEMCVNYMHYYPKTDLEVCKSSIDSRTLSRYFEYMRTMEKQPTSERNGVTENFRSIRWTPLRSQFLRILYQSSPLSMQCNHSSGHRFPGFWEEIPLTPIYHPLPPKKSSCDQS